MVRDDLQKRNSYERSYINPEDFKNQSRHINPFQRSSDTQAD